MRTFLIWHSMAERQREGKKETFYRHQLIHQNGVPIPHDPDTSHQAPLSNTAGLSIKFLTHKLWETLLNCSSYVSVFFCATITKCQRLGKLLYNKHKFIDSQSQTLGNLLSRYWQIQCLMTVQNLLPKLCFECCVLTWWEAEGQRERPHFQSRLIIVFIHS